VIAVFVLLKHNTMSAEERSKFINAVTALQTHSDEQIQHALHKGNAVHFSGFNVINARDLEEVARQHGKRVTYQLADDMPPKFRATDDVDSPAVEPTSFDKFAEDHDIQADASPAGGATRRYTFKASSLTSRWVRNLLAHPQVLNVMIEGDQVIVLTITPSQIVNGLSDRASRGQINLRRTCQRPTYCGKSKASRLRSFRFQLASASSRPTARGRLPRTLP
jgi:hypothetical protein